MKAKRFLRSFTIFGLVVLSITGLSLDVSGQQKSPKKDVKKAEQLARQAAAAFVKKDYRTAADGYAKAAELNPTNPDYRFWKGASHYYLDEYALAVPELDAAQQLGYKKPLDLYSIRWVARFKEKNYDGALEDVKAGLVIDPNNLFLLQA